jgi:hypothetical protein
VDLAGIPELRRWQLGVLGKDSILAALSLPAMPGND